MSDTSADFYLLYEEGYDLEGRVGPEVWLPRRCKVITTVGAHDDVTCLLVAVDPPYRYHGALIDRVMLMPRHQGVSLWPNPDPGTAVHIARVLIDNLDYTIKIDHANDAELLAWGSIVLTTDDARRTWEANRPEFYLLLTGVRGSTTPHACRRILSLQAINWRSHPLYYLAPPLSAEDLGLSGQSIGPIAIGRSEQEVPLLPIDSWPVDALVYSVLVDRPARRVEVPLDQLFVLGSAKLFPAKGAALQWIDETSGLA